MSDQAHWYLNHNEKDWSLQAGLGGGTRLPGLTELTSLLAQLGCLNAKFRARSCPELSMAQLTCLGWLWDKDTSSILRIGPWIKGSFEYDRHSGFPQN